MSLPIKIFGCVVIGTMAISVIDFTVFMRGYYYSDMDTILRSAAMHSMTEMLKYNARPLEYLIVRAANDIYLPLWFLASLVFTVGAAVLTGLACETMFERRLSTQVWWVFGLANPLLLHVTALPNTVSQALSNLIFAAIMLALVTEAQQLRQRTSSARHEDRRAIFLNFMAGALLFTKETAAAAAAVSPAAMLLIRLKARRVSAPFFASLAIPLVAAAGWLFMLVKYPSALFPAALFAPAGGHYSIRLSPLSWVRNLFATLAFPITPLPSSFLEFDRLRLIWIAVSVASVIIFFAIILVALARQPRSWLSLLVVVVSCAPMILIKPSELYSTMIAPFAVAIVFLFALANRPWLSLVYALLLYAASLGNAIIYSAGADFSPFGLQRVPYSIYDKDYQRNLICPIRTTAHVAWNGKAITCR